MSCPAGYTFDTTPRVGSFAAATETFEPGQRIKHWSGEILWTKNHLSASRLEPLRGLGDPLADDALAALKIKRGEDALEALLAYTAQPSDEQKSLAPQRLLTQVMTVPDWVDWDRIQRGQQVFWRYCLFILTALIHFSLASTFSAPKVMKVLNSTGKLSGAKTKKRIIETSQFFFDVLHSIEYLQPGSGLAWKSIVQIRLLHAGVRARLLKVARAHPTYYNLQDHGVPINQEDQLDTLYSLTSSIWWVMEHRQNVQMTPQERGDYLHVWRYVSYMMGVEDLLGSTQNPERADACMESIRIRVETPDPESGRLFATMFHNIALQTRPFFKIIKAVGLLDTYYLHMALAEHLLGPELWEVNRLPPGTRPYRVMKRLIYSLMHLDLWLTTMSPRWFRFRCRLLREYQAATITRYLGRRRTQFELMEMPTVRGIGLIADRQWGEDGTKNSRLWAMVWAAAFAAIGVALVLIQQG